MKKGKARNNGLLPNSLRIISSCLKTVSTNASSVASTVRSAGVSVAASISTASEDNKDQVFFSACLHFHVVFNEFFAISFVFVFRVVYFSLLILIFSLAVCFD